MNHVRERLHWLCSTLLAINFIGIWGLMVIPYLLAAMGVNLGIEPPYHFVDVTIALVAMACGVGVRSLIDVAKAYFNKGQNNVG